VVVPQDQLDRFGHIDSMVRFHDEKAVLVNEYPDEHDWHFNKLIVKTLRNAGIDVTPIPAVVFRKHETLSARGCYMNFLQVANLIALPIFECSYDSIAVKRFETIFNRDKVIPIVAKSIAEQGGVINCVTWNIRKNSSHRRKI
jgi:agmatine deiminase